jgi:uncharacterized caspase-like protein
MKAAATSSAASRRQFLALFGACACKVALGAADSKAALVIGNGAYRIGRLGNPVADARAVATRLAGLGFAVETQENTDFRLLVESLRSFTVQAPRHEVRLLFYSGHGIQWRGRNFLVPVDATFKSEDEIAARCADVGEIVERLSAIPRGLNIVILDACQANPFAGGVYLDERGRPFRFRGPAPDGMTRFETPAGLAPMGAPAGTLIAYSTGPGAIAFDGPTGQHSLYTKHLLSHMAAPGLTLEQLFKRVRSGVAEESARRQIPWETTSLTRDYCFRLDAQGRCGS